MNFERFKSRVTAAADVAKQFKGFDQMAAQDDYIHSPDLNVRQSRRTSPVEIQTTTIGQRRPSVDQTSNTSATLNTIDGQSATSRQVEAAVDSSRVPSTPPSHQVTKMPLLSVVSDLVSEKSQGEKSDQESVSRSSLTTSNPLLEAEYSSDDESFHDAVKGDFDLQKNRQGDSMALNEKGRSHSNIEDGRERSQSNPNRFMEDLDRRMSMPLDIEMANVSRTEETASTCMIDDKPIAASFSDAENKWDWMRNVASMRVNKMFAMKASTPPTQPSQQEREPLTDTGKQNQPRDPHDDYKITASSSVLADEDHAQLQRIQMATHAHPLTIMLEIAKQNPQFVFIAFTVILGSAVYFYARRRGSEDGLS